MKFVFRRKTSWFAPEVAMSLALRLAFNTSTVTSSSFPTSSTLKSRVATYAGGLINNDSSLAVEIQPMTSLTSAGPASIALA